MAIQNKTVALREFRENTQKYISEINKGKSFTVFRRSKPIFNITPSDTWGDDGVWETVVNFTKILKSKEGVPAKDVLKALKILSSR